jgi:hypothetical protein
MHIGQRADACFLARRFFYRWIDQHAAASLQRSSIAEVRSVHIHPNDAPSRNTHFEAPHHAMLPRAASRKSTSALVDEIESELRGVPMSLDEISRMQHSTWHTPDDTRETLADHSTSSDAPRASPPSALEAVLVAFASTTSSSLDGDDLHVAFAPMRGEGASSVLALERSRYSLEELAAMSNTNSSTMDELTASIGEGANTSPSEVASSVLDARSGAVSSAVSSPPSALSQLLALVEHTRFTPQRVDGSVLADWSRSVTGALHLSSDRSTLLSTSESRIEEATTAGDHMRTREGGVSFAEVSHFASDDTHSSEWSTPSPAHGSSALSLSSVARSHSFSFAHSTAAADRSEALADLGTEVYECVLTRRIFQTWRSEWLRRQTRIREDEWKSEQ